jgi:hypothetical protein
LYDACPLGRSEEAAAGRHTARSGDVAGGIGPSNPEEGEMREAWRLLGSVLDGGPPRKALVLCVAVVALAVAGVAAAAGPTHEKSSFSDEINIPAGGLCNFNYHNEFTIYFNDVIFGDPDNPTKIIEQTTVYVTHVNLDTGYTVTEIDHGSSTYYPATDSGKNAGLWSWHLRDPNGKIILVGAGLVRFSNGETLKLTPGTNADFSLICGALGGEPV